jgi:hypothetical protein
MANFQAFCPDLWYHRGRDLGQKIKHLIICTVGDGSIGDGFLKAGIFFLLALIAL